MELLKGTGPVLATDTYCAVSPTSGLPRGWRPPSEHTCSRRGKWNGASTILDPGPVPSQNSNMASAPFD